MTAPRVPLHGVPPLVYGTAWKEERTEALVLDALRAGFRGIDTANQRKHYHEAGVGAALRRAFDERVVRRDDVFLQTKFTYARGQDHRLPYDPRAPVAAQVAQSFASSLDHLGVETLDALLLHGPSQYPEWGDADREAWRAMEALHEAKRVRLLGVSNVLAGQLEALCATAERVQPSLVQNRTFAMPDCDRAVRAFCREREIAYEGFSLLTAIPRALASREARAIAERAGRTPQEVVLRACLDRGIVVLTGTTSVEHMRHDLALPQWALAPEDADAMDAILGL